MIYTPNSSKNIAHTYMYDQLQVPSIFVCSIAKRNIECNKFEEIMNLVRNKLQETNF